MSTNGNNQKSLQEFAKAAAGVQSQFPAKSTVNLAGQSFTPAQLAAVFGTAVTAISAVAPVRAQLAQLVQQQRTAILAARTLYVVLRQFVEATFGKGSPVLAAFGFSTRKPRQPSVETKALGKAQAKLTRHARGTLGKRQKQTLTSSGSPGLVLYGPDGKPILGVTRGPIPPANAGSTGSTPSGSGQ